MLSPMLKYFPKYAVVAKMVNRLRLVINALKV